MSVFLGMDPEAVRDLGGRACTAGTRLEQIRRDLESQVASLEWNGPDADEFRTRFATEVVAAGQNAEEQLTSRGQELDRQATEQDRASAADGGSDSSEKQESDADPFLNFSGTATATTSGGSNPFSGVADGVSDALGWGLDRARDAKDAVGEKAHEASEFVGGLWDAVKPEQKTVQPVDESDIDRHPTGLKDPHSTQDLLENLNRAGAGSRHNDDHANITVQTVRGADGKDHYVVYVPGSHGPIGSTATPWHEGTDNPMGWDQNGPALAGKNTDSADAIREAMRAYGVPQGADVTLVGHSQGGIAASNLAADPGFNGADGYHVSTVVTAGSPVERADVPRGTETINFDHQGKFGKGDDPVPNLDGDRTPIIGSGDTPPNRHEVPLYGREEYGTGAHGADKYADSVGKEMNQHPDGTAATFERDHLQDVVGPGSHATDAADVPVTRR